MSVRSKMDIFIYLFCKKTKKTDPKNYIESYFLLSYDLGILILLY